MARREVPRRDDQGPEDQVHARLRALVCGLNDGNGGNGDNSERVLIDVDLDGQRYLLIQMPATHRKSTSLSPREIEIVRLVAGGHPNKVIAAVLEISSWTVCTHMRRVFAKLGVSSRAAMIARLAEIGGALDALPVAAFHRRPPGDGDNVASRPLDGHAFAPSGQSGSLPFGAHPRPDVPMERPGGRLGMSGTASGPHLNGNRVNGREGIKIARGTTWPGR
jgi:DNA-binding CsgD family transcriptional regulator